MGSHTVLHRLKQTRTNAHYPDYMWVGDTASVYFYYCMKDRLDQIIMNCQESESGTE